MKSANSSLWMSLSPSWSIFAKNCPHFSILTVCPVISSIICFVSSTSIPPLWSTSNLYQICSKNSLSSAFGSTGGFTGDDGVCVSGCDSSVSDAPSETAWGFAVYLDWISPTRFRAARPRWTLWIFWAAALWTFFWVTFSRACRPRWIDWIFNAASESAMIFFSTNLRSLSPRNFAWIVVAANDVLSL